MGLGNESQVGRLVTIQQDMPGDIDGILDEVRRIILLGDIRSVIIRDGEPLTYQRFIRPGETAKPGESTASFAELRPIDVVRQVKMEEYADKQGENSAHKYLMDMVFFMEFDGWVFTHLLIGEKTGFWTWLGLPALYARKLPHFMGARIEKENTLQEDIFILCGAKTRGATIAEIGYALKGNIQ